MLSRDYPSCFRGAPGLFPLLFEDASPSAFSEFFLFPVTSLVSFLRLRHYRHGFVYLFRGWKGWKKQRGGSPMVRSEGATRMFSRL